MKINIHLISTAHRERGKCTSENLFKILNKIKPDVVFCEASTKMYKEFKIGLNQSSLELNSTKKLSENHSFYLVAIDRYPPLNANIRYQIEEIKKALKRNEKYTNTQRKHEENTNRNGFEYLNSDENDELFDEILKNVKLMIPRLGNSEYKNIYEKWLDFHDNRENTMLENINSYVENNELDSAVFLCGSGHRKSILSKIKEKKQTQLEWHFELPK